MTGRNPRRPARPAHTRKPKRIRRLDIDDDEEREPPPLGAIDDKPAAVQAKTLDE